MALPVAFDPQGFPIVNAITYDGGAVGAGVPIELPPQNITQVTTDAGSFAGDFPGASLYRALAANITMTAGSTAVTGAAGSLFLTEIRVGDYIEITAQHSDAVPVLAQVQSIESNTALTLRTAWAGVTATGAAQVCDWYVLITGAASSIAVAAFGATLTAGTANAGRALLARRLGPGGRKGCAPLWARFLLRQNQRLANVTTTFGLSNNIGAAAALDEFAVFNFAGGGTGPDVDGLASHDGLAGGNGDAFLIPGGGSTADAKEHLFEVRLLEDRVVWHIDSQDARTGMPQEYAGEAGIPDPYSEMYVFVQIENIAAVAAGTNLIVKDVHVKSLDIVDTRPVQPDPDKHHVATHDKTAFGTAYTPPAVVNIADNLAHQICTAMEKGHGYLLTQIGGADIQALVVAPGGAAPAVATIRTSPIHMFNGIPWEFRPRVTGEQVYCAKAVDGTSNCDVYHSSTDLGNGA